MAVEQAAHRAYRAIARRPRLVSAAVLLRNQLDHVVRYYFSESFYTCEAAERLLLSTIGPQVERFVDVGANVGRFTAQLLDHAPAGCQGLLLEPSLSALVELRRTFDSDHRVRIVPVAAGECDRSGIFHEDPHAGETSTLVAGAASGQTGMRPRRAGRR